MRVPRATSGLLAATLFLAGGAVAQEPDPAEAPTDTVRWSADAGLALNSTGGNEDLTVIAASFGLTHLRTSIFELGLNTRYRYGKSEEEKVADNLRSELNFDLWPEAAWSPFLFATAERDPIKSLEARLNGGAGAKRTFWQEGDYSEVSLSAAILYSYENLDVPTDPEGGVKETALWSFRVRGRKELTAGNRIEQTVFYQPEFDDFGDYQLESITAARVSISERLAFTTDIIYQRDATPAPDVEPDDYSIAVGLSLATRW